MLVIEIPYLVKLSQRVMLSEITNFRRIPIKISTLRIQNRTYIVNYFHFYVTVLLENSLQLDMDCVISY